MIAIHVNGIMFADNKQEREWLYEALIKVFPMKNMG